VSGAAHHLCALKQIVSDVVEQRRSHAVLMRTLRVASGLLGLLTLRSLLQQAAQDAMLTAV
jgi:hypothetical protein